MREIATKLWKIASFLATPEFFAMTWSSGARTYCDRLKEDDGFYYRHCEKTN